MKILRPHKTVFRNTIAAVVFFNLTIFGASAALLVRAVGSGSNPLPSFFTGDDGGGITLLLIFLGIVLALSVMFSILVSFFYLVRPLRAVCDNTLTISRNILGEEAAPVEGSDKMLTDFRIIAEEVNKSILVLRERGALLQAIVEGIPAMVYYVDADYRVLWANHRAKQWVPELIGMNLKNVGTGFFENERELVQAAFSTRKIQVVNACYLKDEGIQECWEHVAVPVRDDSRNIATIIRICRDITDKRRAENELRRLNETLERRVEEEIFKREEGERIAAQQSRLAALGELATGMAHEITQPLHAVSFSVENIRNRFDSGKMDGPYLHQKIQSIESDIERIRRVIDHMRLFARGSQSESPVAFSVNRCVENALGMIGVQLATHGIDTFLDLTNPLRDMLGNPFQYEQVILNLLANARDAVEDRLVRDAHSDISDSAPGKIWITTAHKDGKIVLTIEDNGVGIPEGMEMKVFDPFFTTKDYGKGTGLGLSISYGIIREMGGIITMERKDHGTSVRVVTPAFSVTEGEDGKA